MKLVNDLVAGIRTIKSYAWENHFLNKINEIRLVQEGFVFRQNIIASLGISIY